MPFQSHTPDSVEYKPIDLSAEFPVSMPERNLRGEVSPIPPHVHDCFEIGYCLEGSGIFIIENKILPFQAGDAVVINHQELHVMQGKREELATWDFINLRPAEMLAQYVGEEERFLNTEAFCGPAFRNIISGNDNTGICQIIHDIMTELTEQRDGYRSQVRALVWSLLVKLHRLVPEETENIGYSRKKLVQIRPALVHIAAHSDSELSIDDLAERCHTSTSNFRKLFHAAVGISPMDYIKSLRLKSAAVMLTTTSRPIGEIALTCGYPTLSNFNRQFKQNHGCSPREYRKNHK